MLDVGDEQTHGGRGARAHGDQDGGNVELRGEAVCVRGAGTAEGHEDEVPRVVSALHRNPPERAHHGVVGDLHDAEGHLDHAEAERTGAPLLDGLPGRRLVEPHLAAEEVICVEPAEDEVRVGDGGLGPSFSVAGGGRIGAGALRADPEHVARVHPGDGAAARADLDEVDDRGANGIAGPLGAVLGPGGRADLVLLGDARGAALDEAGLGGGAAHVEGQDVVEPEEVAEMGGDDDPRGGSRLDHEHGLGAGGLEGQDAAARLHDEELALESGFPQTRLDAGEIPLDDGPHPRVDEGGARPEVLAELRSDLRGERDHRFGERLVHDLARPILVRGIQVGVEIADRDRFHALVLQLPGGGRDRFFVQRRHHFARRVQPLRDSEAQVPRREGAGLFELEVVERWPDLTLDLQHVPEPFGGDEPGGSKLPLDDRVGGHGGAVHEVASVRRLDARLVDDALDGGEKADRGVAGGGGDLRDAALAGTLVDQDRVREGAAHVNPDSIPGG